MAKLLNFLDMVINCEFKRVEIFVSLSGRKWEFFPFDEILMLIFYLLILFSDFHEDDFLRANIVVDEIGEYPFNEFVDNFGVFGVRVYWGPDNGLTILNEISLNDDILVSSSSFNMHKILTLFNKLFTSVELDLLNDIVCQKSVLLKGLVLGAIRL